MRRGATPASGTVLAANCSSMGRKLARGPGARPVFSLYAGLGRLVSLNRATRMLAISSTRSSHEPAVSTSPTLGKPPSRCVIQPLTVELLRRLVEGGYETLLETNGSLDLSPVDARVVKIVDFKCPSSGQESFNRWANVDLLRPSDEVKFVIADRADYGWAKQMMGEHQLANGCAILFSPVWGKLPLKTLAEWILADRLPVRMQTQWHKQIWGPETRGV